MTLTPSSSKGQEAAGRCVPGLNDTKANTLGLGSYFCQHASSASRPPRPSIQVEHLSQTTLWGLARGFVFTVLYVSAGKAFHHTKYE